MNPLFLVAALQTTGAVTDAIVVTGSREPTRPRDAPVPVHSIEARGIELIALPQAADALRLLPGVSVATTGPRGTQTQVRIRGSEANHSLLFVDGIRFNDPAAGNEVRFELLAADLVERIELLSGPQSALWGSEALGGVVAVETGDPFRGDGAIGLLEQGSHGTSRAAARAAVRAGELGLSATGSFLRSNGFDSFGGGGDRDGYETVSLVARAGWRPAVGAELGIGGFYVAGASEYDGLDPVGFRRADTSDETDNRIVAVRGWGRVTSGGWTLSADASLLDSANRNRLGPNPLNRTAGRRTTAGLQVTRRLGGHRLTAAVEHESEEFRARDQISFGAADQDRRRSLTAAIGEWYARWSDAVTTDVAIRHDSFSAFRDSTTVRAAATVQPSGAWSLHASYGEGVAQPTFYDLHGFFPGSFAGNPALRPERGRSWQAGIGWRNGPANLGATVFTASLDSEIVDVFDPVTFVAGTRNVAGTSGRRGIELVAEYRFSRALDLYLNYTWLDANERREPADAAIRETRRPRHSANLIALGERGPLRWSATIAYVGSREDLDTDQFPAPRVRLDDYLLGSARIGWRVADGVEAFARVENAFGADYQDVVGYHTAGRTVHAGIRVRLGD